MAQTATTVENLKGVDGVNQHAGLPRKNHPLRGQF